MAFGTKSRQLLFRNAWRCGLALGGSRGYIYTTKTVQSMKRGLIQHCTVVVSSRAMFTVYSDGNITSCNATPTLKITWNNPVRIQYIWQWELQLVIDILIDSKITANLRRINAAEAVHGNKVWVALSKGPEDPSCSMRFHVIKGRQHQRAKVLIESTGHHNCLSPE